MKILTAVLAMGICLWAVNAFSDQISIMAENDFPFHADQEYTHGTRIQYLNDDSWGISVGQNMYTPTDKKAEELIPYDRPYAGYLYLGAFDTIYFEKSEFYVEGQVGTTGPRSYAEQTQKLIHKWTGSAIPMGWSNQIANHATALVIARYTVHTYDTKYFAFDPYVGCYVGNVSDYLSTGFNVYLGYNLPPDRNQNRVIPFKATKNTDWSPYIYGYCGLEPKIMLYNMLLEDHRFTIHPETYVYDRNVGLVLGCKYLELAVTFCLRSKEFEEQEEPERFGSAKISVKF